VSAEVNVTIYLTNVQKENGYAFTVEFRPPSGYITLDSD